MSGSQSNWEPNLLKQSLLIINFILRNSGGIYEQ